MNDLFKPPLVTVTQNGLVDWDDFNKWAHYNVTYWHNAAQTAEYAALTESDELRWKAYLAASQLAALQLEFAYYQLRNPAPVMGPDGRVYRYVGP